MPKGGRPRQLCSRTVLLGVMLALDSGRPAHLEAAHRALSWLSVPDQLALQVIGGGRRHVATYRQFEDTFSVMCRLIDPSPVPSFQGVAEPARRAHLRSWRAGVDEKAASERLHRLVDALLEASVPEAYKRASSSLAVDWTDHETWAGHGQERTPSRRTTPMRHGDMPSATRLGQKTACSSATTPRWRRWSPTRAVTCPRARPPNRLAAPRLDPSAVMAEPCPHGRSDRAGDVFADCGYSIVSRELGAALRRAGASLVMDLHPNDRGIRGTFEGAISANGQLYCPKTPCLLPASGRFAGVRERGDGRLRPTLCRARPDTGSPRSTAPDGDGYQRVCCPAVAASSDVR